MDLAALSDFQRVAAAGSLSRASRESGRPKATLSRRIRALEESLGVRLIERSPRAMRLTAEGQALYERTHVLLHDIEDIGRNIAAGNDEPRGRLRISAPVLFSHATAGRLVAEFVAMYPQVHIEWVASDRHVDLVEDGFDVAIRVNPAPDSELVGRCFAHDEIMLAAPLALPKPEAHEANGPPHVPAVALASLANLRVWKFATESGTQQLVPDHFASLSSFAMVRDAVRAGLGAGLLPRSMLGADVAARRLVTWGRYERPTTQLWVLHSSRRLVSPKVSAFVAYLCDAFPQRQM